MRGSGGLIIGVVGRDVFELGEVGDADFGDEAVRGEAVPEVGVRVKPGEGSDGAGVSGDEEVEVVGVGPVAQARAGKAAPSGGTRGPASRARFRCV